MRLAMRLHRLHGLGGWSDRQPFFGRREAPGAEDVGDSVRHRDVRTNAQRTLPCGADASDPADGGQDREVQWAAALGPDGDVLLRTRIAGPGYHRDAGPRLHLRGRCSGCR